MRSLAHIEHGLVIVYPRMVESSWRVIECSTGEEKDMPWSNSTVQLSSHGRPNSEWNGLLELASMVGTRRRLEVNLPWRNGTWRTGLLCVMCYMQ